MVVSTAIQMMKTGKSVSVHTDHGTRSTWDCTTEVGNLNPDISKEHAQKVLKQWY